MNMKKVMSAVLAVVMTASVMTGCKKDKPADGEKKISDGTVMKYTKKIERNSSGANVTEYRYDKRGNITREQEYGLGDNDPYIIRDYEYDSRDNVTKKTIRFVEDDVEEVIDYTYEYDDNGNIIKQSYKDNYYGDWEIIETEYNEKGDIIKNKNTNSYGEESLTLYDYTYDDKGRIISEVRNYPVTDKKEYDYVYDDNGNIIDYVERVNGELKENIKYKYDKDNNCIEEIATDVHGSTQKTERIFYANGLVKQEKETTNDGYGDNVEIWEYDEEDRLVKKTVNNADGYWEKTVKEYGPHGILKTDYSDSDGTHRKEEYEYDKNGNRVKYSYESSSGYWEKEEYKYDENGTMLKYTYKSSDGNGEMSEYDKDGNLLRQSFSDEDGEETEENEYDGDGHLIKNTTKYYDGDIVVTVYEYDENGKKIKSTRTSSGGDVSVTVYEYDENGMMIKSTRTVSDEVKEIEEWEYDENGNELLYSDTVPEEYQETVKTEYDENGNEVKYTWTYSDSDGYWEKEESEYDENGNDLRYLYEDCDGNRNETEWEYDENGNVTKKVCTYFDGKKTTEQTTKVWKYDPNNGKCILMSFTSSDGSYEKTEYSYNEHGDLTSEIYEELGEEYTTITRKYDDNGNLIEELESGTFGDTVKKYEYDKDGKILTEDINGIVDSYEYDGNGRLFRQTRKVSSDDPGETTEYEYDSNGNLIKETYRDGSFFVVYEYLDYVCIGTDEKAA